MLAFLFLPLSPSHSYPGCFFLPSPLCFERCIFIARIFQFFPPFSSTWSHYIVVLIATHVVIKNRSHQINGHPFFFENNDLNSLKKKSIRGLWRQPGLMYVNTRIIRWPMYVYRFLFLFLRWAHSAHCRTDHKYARIPGIVCLMQCLPGSELSFCLICTVVAPCVVIFGRRNQC